MNIPPKLAGYVALIASEFGRDAFEAINLEFVVGESVRTIQRNLNKLERAGFVRSKKGKNGRKIWRLTQIVACVDLFSTEKEESYKQNDSCVDLERQICRSGENSKSVSPSQKTKNFPTPFKKEKNSTPQQNPPKLVPSGTNKIPPENTAFPKSDPSDSIQLEQILQKLLPKFGFNNAPGVVMKLTSRLAQSKLQPDEYTDYLTDQLYKLSEKVDNPSHEMSGRKARQLIGSAESIEWYRQDHPLTESQSENPEDHDMSHWQYNKWGQKVFIDSVLDELDPDFLLHNFTVYHNQYSDIGCPEQCPIDGLDEFKQLAKQNELPPLPEKWR